MDPLFDAAQGIANGDIPGVAATLQSLGQTAFDGYVNGTLTLTQTLALFGPVHEINAVLGLGLNLPSLVTLVGPATVNEGDPPVYAFTVHSVDDDGFTAVGDCDIDLLGGGVSQDATGGSFQCLFSDGPALAQVTVQVIDTRAALSNTPSVDTVVSNVDPNVVLNTNDATSFPGGDAFIGRVNVSQNHEADATDPGADDLTFDWNFGSSETYPSNGTAPVAASDDADITFTTPGVYDIAVTVSDGDGGSDFDAAKKIVVDDCDCTKSQGFWKHNFSDKGKDDKIDEESLNAYLAIINFVSNGSRLEATGSRASRRQNGSSKASKASGAGGDPAKIRDKALAQTLAAWLNFAKGAVDLDEKIDTDKDGIAYTAFSDLIAEVEGILLNPDATKDDLNRAKKLAESVNKHDQDNPECDTGTGTGSGSRSSRGSKSNSRTSFPIEEYPC